MTGGRVVAAVGLAVLGGLLLAGAATADWLVETRTRQVGGVALEDTLGTPGTGFAPLAVPLGLAAAVAGPLLALLRGRGRRVAGVVVVGLGLAAAAVVAAGVVAVLADTHPGRPTAAPGLAAAGALACCAGGLVAAGAARPRPSLGARYDLDGDDDDEWRLASADDEEPGAGP